MIPIFLIVKWFGDNVWYGLGVDHIGALMLPIWPPCSASSSFGSSS